MDNDKYDTLGNLISETNAQELSIDNQVDSLYGQLKLKDKKIEELEAELKYLKDCETTWIKMCDWKDKNIENLKAEMARLNRHISMQNLTIAKIKNELDGIPEVTPYSNTAELKQNDFEIIASGEATIDNFYWLPSLRIGAASLRGSITRRIAKYESKNIQMGVRVIED